MTGDLRRSGTELVRRVRAIAEATLDMASGIELLFVTNLLDEDLVDIGPSGVSNAAQYYSRRQAEEIIRSFQELGVTVRTFFSETEFLAALASEAEKPSRMRVVFTTAEGGSGAGRRALIPAACNLMSLPVLNSGAHASSLTRHKFHANAVLRRVGVRVPESWMFDGVRWIGGLAPEIGMKVILKPMYESMCIGVGEDSVMFTSSDFLVTVHERFSRFGQPVLVQEFISGEEVGVPLLRIDKTEALPPVAFRHHDGQSFGERPRTFQEEVVDASVMLARFEADDELLAHLSNAAILAFDALTMKGAGRIDFRLDADGRAWAIDTNESPPPLPNTSYAVSMAALGFSVSDMLAAWLGACLLDAGLLSGVRPE